MTNLVGRTISAIVEEEKLKLHLFDLLYITTSCTANPQQIEQMEFELEQLSTAAVGDALDACSQPSTPTLIHVSNGVCTMYTANLKSIISGDCYQ